jgi:hypothetical protein
MFGGNVVITPLTRPGVTTRSAAVTASTKTVEIATKKVTQTTMSSFLYDSFLVDSIKKKERAAKTKKEDAASAAASATP